MIRKVVHSRVSPLSAAQRLAYPRLATSIRLGEGNAHSNPNVLIKIIRQAEAELTSPPVTKVPAHQMESEYTIINRLDRLHSDRKLIQTLYMDGVRWDDLLLHFSSRYTRSEMMGFVAGQTRHHPLDQERTVDQLLQIYLLAHDPLSEPEASPQVKTNTSFHPEFREHVEQRSDST